MAGTHSRKERTSRASPVDREVGLRIRSRRQAVGLSQQQMAELIGTTYQRNPPASTAALALDDRGWLVCA